MAKIFTGGPCMCIWPTLTELKWVPMNIRVPFQKEFHVISLGFDWSSCQYYLTNGQRLSYQYLCCSIRLFLLQYIPRNMHTVFALLCFVVVIHWLIFPYPSGLLHWHCGNLTIAPVPAKQPWWIWINTSCEFIMNDCITTTKQSTTKPCAYFVGYTVFSWCNTGFLPTSLLHIFLAVSYSAVYVQWNCHNAHAVSV